MKADDEQGMHATLSPSSSHRWMHCAGSVQVNGGGGRESTFAAEGTAAHNLLEMCQRIGTEPEKFVGRLMYKDIEVTDEMAEAVGLALDWVNAYQSKQPDAKVHIDYGVDPAPMIKCAPGLTSGTLDIGIENAPIELVIIDYKHGAGVGVEVEGNTQLMQYLMGLYAQRATRPFKQYRLVIIQPRHRHHGGPVREEVITHAQLLAHAKLVGKRIKFIEANPTHREAGEWCRFCAASGKCRTQAAHAMQAAAMEFGDVTMRAKPVDPQQLTPDEVGHALQAWRRYIEPWGKALYAAALEYMLAGNEVPEHKLVNGRRTRKWKDEQKVKRMLKVFGFTEDEFAPRYLVGVPDTEKLFKARIRVRGRKATPLPPKLMELIELTPPTIHIAPTDDPRAPVVRGQEQPAEGDTDASE